SDGAAAPSLRGVQPRGFARVLSHTATHLLALEAASAGELEVDHGEDFLVGEPAVVPEHREGVAGAAEPVAAGGARGATLVGDHAPGPAPAHDGRARQVFPELNQAVVTELVEFRAQVGQGLV